MNLNRRDFCKIGAGVLATGLLPGSTVAAPVVVEDDLADFDVKYLTYPAELANTGRPISDLDWHYVVEVPSKWFVMSHSGSEMTPRFCRFKFFDKTGEVRLIEAPDREFGNWVINRASKFKSQLGMKIKRVFDAYYAAPADRLAKVLNRKIVNSDELFFCNGGRNEWRSGFLNTYNKRECEAVIPAETPMGWVDPDTFQFYEVTGKVTVVEGIIFDDQRQTEKWRPIRTPVVVKNVSKANCKHIPYPDEEYLAVATPSKKLCDDFVVDHIRLPNYWAGRRS